MLLGGIGLAGSLLEPVQSYIPELAKDVQLGSFTPTNAALWATGGSVVIACQGRGVKSTRAASEYKLRYDRLRRLDAVRAGSRCHRTLAAVHYRQMKVISVTPNYVDFDGTCLSCSTLMLHG